MPKQLGLKRLNNSELVSKMEERYWAEKMNSSKFTLPLYNQELVSRITIWGVVFIDFSFLELTQIMIFLINIQIIFSCP